MADYTQVTIKFSGSYTVKVNASDEYEAEELARDKFEEALEKGEFEDMVTEFEVEIDE